VEGSGLLWLLCLDLGGQVTSGRALHWSPHPVRHAGRNSLEVRVFLVLRYRNHRLGAHLTRQTTVVSCQRHSGTTLLTRKGDVIVDTFERVKKIIVDQLGVEEEKVVKEARFREDLEADSLDLVELVMAFEEEFGGSISDEEAQQITSVADIVKFVEEKLT
jgi:acyl carrier protein